MHCVGALFKNKHDVRYISYTVIDMIKKIFIQFRVPSTKGPSAQKLLQKLDKNKVHTVKNWKIIKQILYLGNHCK